MRISHHVSLTGTALKRWFIAQCYDSLAVGAMWTAGLWFLHVPFAPFWGVIAAGLQFIPQFGTVLSFFGPALAALFTDEPFERVLYVLILYGVIVVVDGLVFQPLIMRRTARVPIWASLIVPILLSLVFGFWGLLLAAPLLAVLFTYRAYHKNREPALPRQTPPGEVITGGQLISPGGDVERTQQP